MYGALHADRLPRLCSRRLPMKRRHLTAGPAGSHGGRPASAHPFVWDHLSPARWTCSRPAQLLVEPLIHAAGVREINTRPTHRRVGGRGEAAAGGCRLGSAGGAGKIKTDPVLLDTATMMALVAPGWSRHRPFPCRSIHVDLLHIPSSHLSLNSSTCLSTRPERDWVPSALIRGSRRGCIVSIVVSTCVIDPIALGTSSSSRAKIDTVARADLGPLNENPSAESRHIESSPIRPIHGRGHSSRKYCRLYCQEGPRPEERIEGRSDSS